MIFSGLHPFYFDIFMLRGEIQDDPPSGVIIDNLKISKRISKNSGFLIVGCKYNYYNNYLHNKDHNNCYINYLHNIDHNNYYINYLHNIDHNNHYINYLHNIDHNNYYINYLHNIDHNNYYIIIFNIVIVDNILNMDDYHDYIYITDNDNRDHHHYIYDINSIHYFYILNISIIDIINQDINQETRIIDIILVNITVKHKRCHRHWHQLRTHHPQAEANISSNILLQRLSREHQRETTREGREHLQKRHPKQGCNNINISKNIKNSIASDDKIEIEKHIKQRIASNIIKINILEMNSINKDEREEDINIGVPDQSIKHIEMDIIIISLLNKLHNISREQKTEEHIIDIRETEYNIKIYKINIKVYKISIVTYRINIRIQDNKSVIIIEDSSHNYHDCILGLESLLVINDHNLIIIDHNTLRSFTNIKRALKTNIYLEISIYIKHCNLDILTYNRHLTTQVDILEDDIYISITIIANIVVITEQKIGLDNYIHKIDLEKNPYIKKGQFITKMMGIYKEHFAHILWHFANIRTAKICHYIFLVILINNIRVCISIIKNLLSYIVYIEQHHYNSIIYIVIIFIIIIVIVNYSRSLDINNLHLNIICLTTILVNIIIHFITISSSNIEEADYSEDIQHNIINVICIRSSNIEELDYSDYIHHNVVNIISSINLKETLYLAYIRYTIIYIINSDNNIREIDHLDHIQLNIIIVVYFSIVIDSNYLYNIQSFIIMIISSSNINKITLSFSIIDYLINNLVIIIKNINTDIYGIKIINVIHINYKHYIDIENIQTNNIIDYKNINETDNKIYFYIINIINSHTIIDTYDIQYNITIYISYVIIMTVETYQSISYILIDFYGFIIILETGHPIGDVNLILYISTKKKSYIITAVLHHKDRHHHYIQNIDDIERGASLHLERCIFRSIGSIDEMHREDASRQHQQEASTRCIRKTSEASNGCKASREHRGDATHRNTRRASTRCQRHQVSQLSSFDDVVATCHHIKRGCERTSLLHPNIRDIQASRLAQGPASEKGASGPHS